MGDIADADILMPKDSAATFDRQNVVVLVNVNISYDKPGIAMVGQELWHECLITVVSVDEDLFLLRDHDIDVAISVNIVDDYVNNLKRVFRNDVLLKLHGTVIFVPSNGIGCFSGVYDIDVPVVVYIFCAYLINAVDA